MMGRHRPKAMGNTTELKTDLLLILYIVAYEWVVPLWREVKIFQSARYGRVTQMGKSEAPT